MHKFKVKARDQIGKAMDCFLNSGTQNARFGKYVIENDTLSYRTPVNSDIWVDSDNSLKFLVHMHSGMFALVDTDLKTLQDRLAVGSTPINVEIRYLKENVIAKRVKNAKGTYKYTGNKDALGLIGRKICFGNEKANRYITEIQKRLSKLIKMKSFDGHKEHGYHCGCAREG